MFRRRRSARARESSRARAASARNGESPGAGTAPILALKGDVSARNRAYGWPVCDAEDTRCQMPAPWVVGHARKEPHAGQNRNVGSESWASTPGVRRSMKSNRGRDTRPELAVRRLVHAAGLRYRVDYRPIRSLNRRADLVFTAAKVAVFLDGCFWHGCPEHHTVPRTNAPFWAAKVAKNKERDEETDRLLRANGWSVVRAWEHEPASAVAARVVELVRAKRGSAALRR